MYRIIDLKVLVNLAFLQLSLLKCANNLLIILVIPWLFEAQNQFCCLSQCRSPSWQIQQVLKPLKAESALLSLHCFLIMGNSLERGREVTKLILPDQNRILKNELVANHLLILCSCCGKAFNVGTTQEARYISCIWHRNCGINHSGSWLLRSSVVTLNSLFRSHLGPAEITVHGAL